MPDGVIVFSFREHRPCDFNSPDDDQPDLCFVLDASLTIIRQRVRTTHRMAKHSVHAVDLWLIAVMCLAVLWLIERIAIYASGD